MADQIKNLTDDEVFAFDNAEPVSQNTQIAKRLQDVIKALNAMSTDDTPGV